MKRLLRKLRLLAFGCQGTALHCPKCKSLHVGFGNTTKSGDVETYPVNCKDCGAVGTITEVWRNPIKRSE